MDWRTKTIKSPEEQTMTQARIDNLLRSYNSLLQRTYMFMVYGPNSSSPPRLQLRDHPLDLDRLLTCGFRAQILQRVHILGFQRHLTSFDEHAALNPHLDTLRHREICALGNKSRCEPGVASSEGLVVEGLTGDELG